MKLTGAQAVWESLVREGVDTAFGISGGAVIHLYHALPEYPIHHVLMRHEQAAAHAADGYARATGKVGVCIATSGPGATNLVTGLATAQMDSSPVVAITGQVATSVIGTDAFQEVDIVGITQPITKHNYLVTDVEDLPEVMKEAFHIARTGRPGPVLVDIAKDVQAAELDFAYPDDVHLPGYYLPQDDLSEPVRRVAQMLAEAERPLIIAGHGIHRLCLGMAGMHGEAYTNLALSETDLLISLGSRFDDRLTGKLDQFCNKARIVHVDIDPAEIDKNVTVDVAVIGDLKDVLPALTPLVEQRDREAWLERIEEWRDDSARRDIVGQETDELVPQYVVRQLWEATQGEVIVVSDVGQNQMWEAQYFTHHRRRGLLSSGGLGTMGFALPAAIGAQMGRRGEQVWVTVGDGGFQMNIQSLAVVAQERLPIKVAVLNNGYLGMVRQWQQLFFEGRYSGTPLLGPDFPKVAEAYGIAAFTVRDKSDVVPTIEQAMALDGPTLIDFVVEQEENVYPMVAPGAGVNNMIRRPQGKAG
jgi:acetolactate synthase-1/2/3 large subunit